MSAAQPYLNDSMNGGWLKRRALSVVFITRNCGRRWRNGRMSTTTRAIAVAMVVVAIAATVLPLFTSGRVFIFLVQVVPFLVLASATSAAAFSAHNSVILSVACTAGRPIIVIHVIIAGQIRLKTKKKRNVNNIYHNIWSKSIEWNLSTGRCCDPPGRQTWTISSHAHTFFQVRCETRGGHIPLAVGADAFSWFFTIDCRWR